MKKSTLGCLVLIGVAAAAALAASGRSMWVPAYQKVKSGRTVAEVVAKYGPGAEGRIVPRFEEAGLPYPPEKVTLVALKAEKLLELWASGKGGWKKIKSYDILGASGGAGPKLREGDRQVPEGLYRIAGLNPNSSYHLSMKLNYPNAFDVEQGGNEGRDNLGGDIFIHGKTGSVGCLAMGDPAIEELFTVVEKVGRAHTQVIISPRDFRKVPWKVKDGSPAWLPGLYAEIDHTLKEYR